MRKGIIIGILVIVLGMGGLIAFKQYQEQRMREEIESLMVYEDESKGDVGESIDKIQRFYAALDIVFRKIDSLDRKKLRKIDNGSAEYKKYLISESRNLPFNFQFFPYEIIEHRGLAALTDTASDYATWPWSLCCYSGWTIFPRTDSTGLKSYDMSSYYYQLESAAKEFPDPDSIRYLHILVNYDDRDLKLYDEDQLMSDEMIQAVFEGGVIVYDMKAQKVVKFYPLEFTGSANVQFTYTGATQYSSEAQQSFREAYAADLKTNFTTAIQRMITDSLGIPQTRIEIN